MFTFHKRYILDAAFPTNFKHFFILTSTCKIVKGAIILGTQKYNYYNLYNFYIIVKVFYCWLQQSMYHDTCITGYTGKMLKRSAKCRLARNLRWLDFDCRTAGACGEVTRVHYNVRYDNVLVLEVLKVYKLILKNTGSFHS